MSGIDDIRHIREIIREVLNDELSRALAQALGKTDNDDKQLLSRQQAAEALGVSVQTVAALLHDGVIDYVRVRRRVLIPRRSVQSFLDSVVSSSPRSKSK